MEQYLMDTNVVSDFFSDSFPLKGMNFMNMAIDAIPNLSIITQIELLCWDIDPMTGQKVKNFITDSTVFNINADIVIKCVSLRRNKKIKLPDAIIAATAIVYGLTLISRNAKDFKDIQGLNLIDPHNL